jgi:hypothetical protein
VNGELYFGGVRKQALQQERGGPRKARAGEADCQPAFGSLVRRSRPSATRPQAASLPHISTRYNKEALGRPAAQFRRTEGEHGAE